jgi:hypothetical protein
MPLTQKQRAALDRLGHNNVRTRLSAHLNAGDASAVPGLGDGMMARRDVEDWLTAFDRERADRERASYTYVKWTFWAAVAAAFIGVVGVIMTVYLAR